MSVGCFFFKCRAVSYWESNKWQPKLGSLQNRPAFPYWKWVMICQTWSFLHWLENTTFCLILITHPEGGCNIDYKENCIFLWPPVWVVPFLIWTCHRLFISSLFPSTFTGTLQCCILFGHVSFLWINFSWSRCRFLNLLKNPTFKNPNYIRLASYCYDIRLVGWVLRHINPCGFVSAESCLCDSYMNILEVIF